MKWREHKNLSLEEKREIRREAARVMGEKLKQEGHIEVPDDNEEVFYNDPIGREIWNV